MKLYLSQLQLKVTPSEYKEIESEMLNPIDLANNKGGKILGTIRKEIEIGELQIPHIGENIIDCFWPSEKSEYEVTDVSYDYEAKSCFITLEAFVIQENSDLHKNIEKIAEQHNWKFTKW